MTSKKPRARVARNPLATDLREHKQSEQILAEGLLARSVLEQAADAIVVCDDKGQITRVSRSAEQLCGCSPLRANFDAAFPVVLTSPLLGGGLTANALKGAILRAEPATLTRVDGSKADLLLSATPLQTADGRIIGCVINMVDVSEHRRADEVLRASEARFRSVLEDSRDVIYRVNVQTGHYDYISPSVETAVGFSPDELAGMDVETSQAMIHPDDAPAMRAAAARLETTGKADVEYRQKTKNGDYRWLSNHMSLVKDSSGRPLYRDGNIRDVTEQKQAERALRQSDAQHRTLFDNSIDAIFATAPDGRVFAANRVACQTFGMTEEELIRAGREGITDWSDPRHGPALAERARLGHLRRELGYVRKDGTKFTAEVSSVILPDRATSFVILRDITEREQAGAQREALLAELKAIVASMPDGLITYKQGAPGATINPAAHRILGVPAEDWPRTIAERARLMQVRNEAGLPVDADASPAARALRGDTVASEIMRLQRPDGEERWVSVGAAPIITSTGERVGALTLFSDITERRHADEEFRAGSTLLNSVLTSSLSGIMAFKSIRDAQGRITDFEWQLCNATAERMVGRRATDLVGRKLLVEMPGNKADGLFDKYVVVVETGKPLHHEHYYEHEGLKTWFETCAVQLGDGFAVTFSDITNRKQAEEELRAAQQRLESLLANSPLAVIEWSSADYRIVRWSNEATRVFGWTAEETVGKRIDELNWVYAEDWPLVTRVMGDMLSGKCPRNVNKNRNVRKDGMVIHCEWYNSTLHHPDGKFSVLSLVLDVTERKRAEESLAHSNLKLAEVLDSIQDDFYVLDRDWKFIFASRRFTSRIGKQPEDFIGNNIWEMFSKHLGTAYEENLRAAMDKRETRRFEIGGKYTDAWYRMTASPSAEGITVLGTEITENKKIEEALREADQRKNEFLAMLSHELRNPLAPIRNSVQILEHAAPGSEQAKRALAVIDRQAGQLAHLVDDLLDATRITRSKIELQRQTLDLNELVRHTVEDQCTLFDKADVHVEFQPAPAPVFANGDRNRLAQVIGNLLQNAAKFTGRGGKTRITVSADATKGRAVIQVADTGVGMVPEMIARLFQPFAQADSTLDRSKGGLGLGLALAKGLVDLHGGDITARSAGLGQGAEFVVRLPLAKEDSLSPRPAATASRGRRRVLIIEDNVDAADSLRDVLAFAEHEVEVAYNGPQGIAKAQEFRPDIVFCDIGLPIMDGYEVARAFRADDALKGTFLVALSGYTMPEDLERASAAGFERHLAKPPSLEKLEEILASR